MNSLNSVSGSSAYDSVRETFRWVLGAALGDREAYGRALLGVLAFGEGPGRPVHVWRASAVAVVQRAVSYDDLGWLMRAAGEFMKEDLDAEGRSAYRLSHEAFAEDLRSSSPAGPQRSISLALMNLKGHSGVESQRDWAHADSYVRNHLAVHAVAAGILEQLVTDPAFLESAERSWLLRALESGPELRERALLSLPGEKWQDIAVRG